MTVKVVIDFAGAVFGKLGKFPGRYVFEVIEHHFPDWARIAALLFRFGGEFRPSLSRDQNLTYQGVNGYAFSLRFFKLGSLHIRRKIERQRHGNPSLYRNLPILRRFTNFVTGNLAS
jgi:hypothetical protein